MNRKTQNKEQKQIKAQGTVRERILQSACRVINEKGYSGASVRDIAAEAGLTEPTIYLHFKGKEEVLFSIVEQQVEDSLVFMREHMAGISGAHQKLRKLIWAHLRYNDLHQDYLKLVLLDCRSNYSFYKSDAYKVIRRYSGIVLSIIQEGIDEGVYPLELNARLMRDIVLGVLDFEAYTVLITKEIPDATQDHEAIMALLDNLLLGWASETNDSANKSKRILQAAIKAFAKKGYAGATISDIAKAAKVSDGTVYEHFKNKEDLLLSIPEEYFQSHLDRLEQSFNITDNSRKLRRFIQYHFRLYLDDYDFLLVYLLLIQLNRTFYKTRAYTALKSYMAVFEKLVEDGIKDGSFVAECNVRVYRNMFFGAFTHMTLRWFVVECRGQVDKLSEINQATKYFLDMITPKGEREG
ncbi:MAG: TetR/AcrR family transcriptional regulator [Proteobacteria bacterium]|nr:TetR/AcrR family transcriptional regulator [Pseudomonadota bacterium]MBU1450693.1 TetR/AcrR family transcriptional regulator [Pseudomonadota bacterium]MBU2468632.1 TetR/AcrR family transcriptional regulator [Pseudomonadota bacterium]MBU2517668.1 TetR/AcrR family transcriptional regulator [Pseudomonadota bacterium]